MRRKKTVVLFVFSSLFLSLWLFNLKTPIAQAAPSAISGTVYRDYDADGTQDTLEPGIAGVLVTAYGVDNTILGLGTTNGDGIYAIAVSASGTGYRLEFSPNSDQAAWLKAGPAQVSDGATNVVFVSDGASSVNVGFSDPSQFCNLNPDITTTCFTFGDHADLSTPDDAVKGFVYGDYGFAPAQTQEVRTQDVGSVYGIAYQRNNDRVFSSAYLKRHSDFGPNGAGAIYVTNRTSGATTLFADLNNIALPNDVLLPSDTAGVDPRNPASIAGTYAYTVTVENGTVIAKTVSKFWYHDPETFDKVGEFGLGDIDISGDESQLFVVNMKDRQLYIIDANQTGPATKLAANPIAIPNNCVNAADARPMASKYHDGKVYVGVVCSAESTQNLAELKADIFVFDPIALSFDTTPVLTAPLNYDRGCVWRGNLFSNPAPSGSCSGSPDNNANWRPWNNIWEDVFDTAQNSGNSHFYIEYPQPLLADIEFDNGNMALGFRDVLGDRVGYCAGVPDSAVTPQTGCQVDAAYAGVTNGQGMYRGTGMGDLLRACGNPTDGWTLENNGSCSTASGQNSQQGPNGGEYYWNAQGPGGPGSQLNGGAEWWAQNSGHDQTVIGGLMQIPGQPYIVTNQIDSSNVYNAGLVYFSNADGSVSDVSGVRKAVVYDLNPDTFGKANGLGDIEALCDAAPTQVGNRVWNDSTPNGVQDPGESGVVGVELTLTCGANSATVISAADGTYLFTNDTRMNTADPSISYINWMDAGEACSIQVTNGAPGGSAITTGTLATNDLHDNDADSTGTINFVVGLAGDNDHNLDIGYASTEHTKPVGDGAIGNYVWLDENSDGAQDAGERGIPNVVVMMTDAFGNIYQTVTDADGKYLFPNLGVGTYTVSVKGTNFLTDDVLDGYTQTPLGGGSADFGNKDDAGYVITLGLEEENLSADFGYNTNPTGDVDGNTGNAAVGDRVWVDLDGDGVQDPNEIGVSGVGVTLYNAGPDGLFGTPDDVALQTTTTDATGNYLFDELTPDAYQICVTGSDMASADILASDDYAQTGDPDHFGRDASSLGSDPFNMTGDNCSTQPVILAPGDVFLNVDFGYQPEAGTPIGSIGNTIWFDADADQNGPSNVNSDTNNGAGSADDSEQPIVGVSVALIDDLNGNGEWNAGEPIVATDVTDDSGQYFFGGLPLEQCSGGAGIDQLYLVWVNDTDSVLGGMAGTFDSDGDSGPGNDLTAVAGFGLSASTINCTDRDDVDQDFGYTEKGHFSAVGLVGDTVWFDANGNSTQDADEHGIEGVQLTIFDSGGNPIGTAMTNENGMYSFGNLPLNDTYTVQVDASNFAAGGVLQGMTQTYDEDAPLDNASTSITLTAGTTVDLNQDFGYQGAAAGLLGNLVWLDLNANGTYDAANGESSIADVTIDLYRDLNCNGLVDTADVLFAQTTTVSAIDDVQFGSHGIYSFTNLPTVGAGANGGACYVVDVTDNEAALAGYWHSLGTAGTSNESQPDPYGNSGALELTNAAVENLTADFGYYVDPACLGNHVFFDGNGDDLQGNATDYGLGGVMLTLDINYDNGDSITLSTMSQGNGSYQFCNLLVDEDYNDSVGAVEPDFVISAETPAGMTPVTADQGDDLLDGDNPAGVSADPVQGEQDTSPQDPATGEDPIASYDFGYTGAPAVAVDYSDAPDSYGTTTTENGAAHTINGTLYLGACVDGEGNGSPDAFAGTFGSGGDDNTTGVIFPNGASCSDDEDGITTDDTTWVEGVNGATVTVDASADGCLNAWVDFNRDGIFLGANEHVIVNQLVNASTGNINIDVPVGGVDASTFARYRLSPRNSGLCSDPVAPTGTVAGGEVEDFFYDFGEEVDFGDLPAGYDVTAGEDGASHVITPGLNLGATVDGDADGQPNGVAEGDDANGDDEDGVLATEIDWNDGVNGGSVGVIVNGDGCLNGWIDWNSDYTFSGSGEHVIVNQLVSSGSINFDFDIPTGGTAQSPRFARYRLTPRDGNNGCSEVIGATGRVVGGEVEDYQYIVNGQTAITLRAGEVMTSVKMIAVFIAIILGTITIVTVRRRKGFDILS